MFVAAGAVFAQQPRVELPDAPSQVMLAALRAVGHDAEVSSSSAGSSGYSVLPDWYERSSEGQDTQRERNRKKAPVELDANGNPLPMSERQPQRILGFMPNFRSVGSGAKPHPPGWGYNFKIATRQSFDYSSFVFLGLTSISAEWLDEHPVLGKGVHGLYSYTWRGLLDKTDGTYIGAWFLPSLLHEDTRYYAMGNRRSVPVRILYIISRQAMTRTYGGRDTVNIGGLGGKVLTQVVSREYYPAGATSFGVLAEKFGYSSMRDVGFTSIREFYPEIAAHYVRKHHEKLERLAAAAAQQTTSPSPAPMPAPAVEPRL